MTPLFSLETPVSALAEPIDPSLVIIREGLIIGVCDKAGKESAAIAVESCAPLSSVCLRIGESSLAMPSVVTLDEHGSAVGLLSAERLFASILAICGNQAVLLGTLLDTMSEATTIVDRNNMVQFWNPAAEKIYEIARNDVIGTPLETHFASDSIRLMDALQEGTSVERVYHVPRPDRHVLINSAPIKQNGEIIGAISIEQDITELVKLNEELAHTTAHLHNLQQEMSRFQAADDPFFVIKGHSAPIQAAIQSAKKVAQTDATVLIYGESGVGKELFAQAIHQASRRHDKSFIAINCAAIPAALFESELFGYQGGAFTGAEKKGKPGKLEMAHGGTLFLDEIGELPLELQAKLLRALQERQFYRVGGTEPITVNTRIIAATNRELEQMVAEGTFREDLYYRLHVFSLEIPPLRQRREDIPELVQIFLQEHSVTHQQPVPRIASEVMRALYDFSWPGNIRQLRNIIERLCILQEGGVILLEHLPASFRTRLEAAASSGFERDLSRQPAADSFGSSLAAFRPEGLPEYRNLPERERILAAIERTYGNKKAAAELLGMSRGTLYNKLRKYGIAEGE